MGEEQRVVQWRFGQRRWDWAAQPGVRVMGVLNVTPDSFSDGGRYVDPEAAVAQALALVAQGADLIDVGGESSRPGRTPVSADEERARVIPVIQRLRAVSAVPISIDTVKLEVAEAAIEAGADIVNDIGGLQDPALARLVARTGVGAVVMHMRGQPETMQTGDLSSPDLVGEVLSWAEARLAALEALGVSPAQICFDPGIGFGKTVAQNVALLAELPRLLTVSRPWLIGVSRKSFLGALTERPVEARGPATTAAQTAAVLSGAHLLRVHDAAAAVDAVRVAEAIRGGAQTA